jgi:pimeloyl-ACP methyl ester carboxylesterase
MGIAEQDTIILMHGIPIQGVSHWVPQDAPDEFAKAVLNFLN